MASLPTVLQVILLVFVVLMIFNVIIFVHELGHFLAAKWRGLRIDRFQIWFGRPLWKKEINGVQYGLGWIPAGGFVALPQMAPMESIEGGNKDGKPLPPITPMDKIIVAFAGPLFSMLLALLAATVVWGVGKPADFIPSQVIGTVVEGSPAEQAGLKAGDKITHVNGKKVNGYTGSLDGIFENIILSKGKKIEFSVERPGTPGTLTFVSEFKTAETKWYQRGGLRQVGIGPEVDHLEIGSVTESSPAAKAGLKEGDILVSMGGIKFKSDTEALNHIRATGAKPIVFEILRKHQPMTITATPQVPISPPGKNPMLGIIIGEAPFVDETIVHPKPITQVADSLRMMWTTITSVVSKDSSIGIDQLSGPVGIAKVKYAMLQMEHPWQRILAFMVLFNVNLAVMNMLPFPVLDGGHITLAVMEAVARRPVKAKVLEVVQTAFALALISLMLYVTSKDIGDGFGRGGEKIVFPAN